jgi:hypothetical protein
MGEVIFYAYLNRKLAKALKVYAGLMTKGRAFEIQISNLETEGKKIFR